MNRRIERAVALPSRSVGAPLSEEGRAEYVVKNDLSLPIHSSALRGPTSLGLFERLLGLFQILKAPFKFGPVNLGALVKSRILDRDGGRNCERLRETQVFLGEDIRLRVAEAQDAKHLV